MSIIVINQTDLPHPQSGDVLLVPEKSAWSGYRGLRYERYGEFNERERLITISPEELEDAVRQIKQ